jgi:hypothetical protein
VTPRKLKLPPGLNYDNIDKLVEDLEGPAQRRLAERSMLPTAILLAFLACENKLAEFAGSSMRYSV